MSQQREWRAFDRVKQGVWHGHTTLLNVRLTCRPMPAYAFKNLRKLVLYDPGTSAFRPTAIRGENVLARHAGGWAD